MLGVQGGRTAGAGGRNGLPVGVVNEVAAREDSGHVRGGGAANDLHVAVCIRVNDALDQFGPGVVANGP